MPLSARYRSSALARRKLDERLEPMKGIAPSISPPPKGWTRAIREALGMSEVQLARRLHIKQSSLAAMEQSEAAGTVRLKTLRRAAEALDCTLVYALVPNQSLEEMFSARRRSIAEEHLRRVEHSMRLENQAVTDSEARRRQLDETAQLVDLRTMWDDH